MSDLTHDQLAQVAEAADMDIEAAAEMLDDLEAAGIGVIITFPSPDPEDLTPLRALHFSHYSEVTS